MNLQANNQILRPIVKAPEHNYDNFKTARQTQLENNLRNESAKKVVRQSINDVYESFRKLVENKDYSVRYNLDSFSGVGQVRVVMNNTANEVATLPPDVARHVAEKAKQANVGLIVDFYA